MTEIYPAIRRDTTRKSEPLTMAVQGFDITSLLA